MSSRSGRTDIVQLTWTTLCMTKTGQLVVNELNTVKWGTSLTVHKIAIYLRNFGKSLYGQRCKLSMIVIIGRENFNSKFSINRVNFSMRIQSVSILGIQIDSFPDQYFSGGPKKQLVNGLNPTIQKGISRFK